MRFACSLAVLAACGSTPDDEPALATFIDLDADPNVVEVELVAGLASVEYLPGKRADVWAYRDGARAGSRGTVPGPLLEAKLGDRVIVHFRNELPEPTTVHWHGLRIANASDGTTASQLPVPPGGTFDYELALVDAGLFWYHPHMRGDVQVERGLYAPLRVLADDGIDVAADRVFVLDDVKLESSGQLSERTDSLDLMLGRRGNVVLVNGRTAQTVAAAAGTRERWRFVNAANGRYFWLELPGRTFTVIGWDGGLVALPYTSERLLVAPGERYEVLVDIAGVPGETLALRSVHYDRGHDIPDPGPVDLFTLEIGDAGAVPRELPNSFGTVAPLVTDATTMRRRFVLREDDTDPASPVFTINDEAFPYVTPVETTANAIEIWDIVNATEMDHPFHLHGMSFQVPGMLAWKDTVNVQRGTTVSLAVQVGPAGHWMFHCHILEHAERGMMGHLHVNP